MIVADSIKYSTQFLWLLAMMNADIASLSCFHICVPAVFFTCCRDVSEVFYGPHGFNKSILSNPVLFLNGSSKSAVCMSLQVSDFSLDIITIL
jgi:hypothetical protein